jgi:hypothetical protein
MMQHRLAAWSLMLGLVGLASACDVRDSPESIEEIEAPLGFEESDPGSQLPDGSGWAGAPYCPPTGSPRDQNPFAGHGNDERTCEENRHHGVGSASVGRFYNGGRTVEAPDADLVPSSIHKPLHDDGPLDDKARCVDDCWNQFLVDTAYCRKIRDKDRRQQCWIKSEEDYGLCVRECSRKYPGK